MSGVRHSRPRGVPFGMLCEVCGTVAEHVWKLASEVPSSAHSRLERRDTGAAWPGGPKVLEMLAPSNHLAPCRLPCAASMPLGEMLGAKGLHGNGCGGCHALEAVTTTCGACGLEVFARKTDRPARAGVAPYPGKRSGVLALARRWALVAHLAPCERFCVAGELPEGFDGDDLHSAECDRCR